MKIRAIDYSVCFLLGVFLLVGCCNVATGSLPGDLSGDGMVDLLDVRLFAGQWLDGPQYPPQGLLAHWQFDEDDGVYAIDSTSNGYTAELKDGGVRLNEGGLFDKVLQFDGADDYVIAPYVLNPYFGPFSAFAWVKGGAAKEVIISQTNGQGLGREWLHTDPTYGKLLTRVTGDGSALISEAVITDGNWHHIGVVWDGSRRYLYADGAEVASDPSPLSGKLYWCDGDLHIGAGNTEPLEDFHFWSGLIDDVRIYSRAVSAAEIDLMANPPEPEQSSADLDGNMRVDFADFAILAKNWRIDASGEYRCIWVDSWSSGFLTAFQCDDLIQTCRDNNINTVIVEVRKVGDACYNSNIEPRATNISASFDPLGYLLDIAHDTSGGKKYVEVHAWFVAQRISTSATLHPGHVLSKNPEFVMINSDGQTSESGSNTKFLDPGHPGSIEHNVEVITDCLINYDIDGINLDYIRYPEYAGSWGYNAVSVARFNAFYGKSGQPSPSDPDWSDWRRECMTHQVKKIYVKSLMIDPDVVVTTDTVTWGGTAPWLDFESSRTYTGVFQDWVGWLQEGIIDYNAMMGYIRRDRPGYEDWLEGWGNLSLDNDDIRGSILSTGAYLQYSVQDSIDQLLDIRSWGADGLNIYDWGSEVNANTQLPRETRADFYRELKAQVFPEWIDPPTPQWKVRPTRGIFEGSLRVDGFSVDHGSVEIEGQPETRVYTDGTGWYAILEIPPGEYRLRFSKPGYADVISAPTMLTAGQIITVDADL